MLKTPLIEVTNKLDIKNGNKIFLKLESLNLSGSIKDRIVKYILDDGIKNNGLSKGKFIVVFWFYISLSLIYSTSKVFQ